MTTSKCGDIVIVGGGVIGLSIAYALAREGLRPILLDRREPGREASWAGAGLIPPIADRPPGGGVSLNPLAALRGWSARLYPEWSAALQDETGIDPGYRRTGGVDVAWTAHEDDALRAAAGQWRAEGIAWERIPPGDHARVEPALNPKLRSVYFLPDRAQVRNPRLLAALKAAVVRRGAVLEGYRAALGFTIDGRRITAVRTEAGEIPCGRAIVAAGAWSGGLLEPAGVRAPTPPIKGQIVLLRAERPLLRRVVEHGKNYIVPRDDGRILVGATEETAGFDTRPTAAGARDLLGEAIRLCPALGEAAIEATWAGLRPGSVDGRPYLGVAPEVENLILATGHRRAGLQLAPGTAELVVDLVLGRTPRLDLSPFRPSRSPTSEPADDDAFRS
ncbi:MAG: glycine oxidase ThiO [Isosphaeraceae bacterium]